MFAVDIFYCSSLAQDEILCWIYSNWQFWNFSACLFTVRVMNRISLFCQDFVSWNFYQMPAFLFYLEVSDIWRCWLVWGLNDSVVCSLACYHVNCPHVLELCLWLCNVRDIYFLFWRQLVLFRYFCRSAGPQHIARCHTQLHLESRALYRLR